MTGAPDPVIRAQDQGELAEYLAQRCGFPHKDFILFVHFEACCDGRFPKAESRLPVQT